MNEGCVFCDIIAGEAPAEFVMRGAYAVAIKPLKPVVEDHFIVLPTRHVADFSASPMVSAMTMEFAAEVAQRYAGDLNMITSRGPSATQSVFHLHLHLIPRRENDGLALPWYSGRTRGAKVEKDYPPEMRAFLDEKRGLRK